jgi:hypothetical protein
MTILVALHDPIYGTVIGSDTQYTSVGNKMCIPGGKWVFANGWAIGVCGEMKFLNIIRENAEAVLLHNVSPLSISYALFEMFGDAGYTFKSTEDDAVDGGFQMVAGSFLLANSEATWEIESNARLDRCKLPGPGRTTLLVASTRLKVLTESFVCDAR